MTVEEIVKQYLKANNYDGLCGEECGCSLDDFMPCEDSCNECEPAHKAKCKHCGRKVMTPDGKDVEVCIACEGEF